MGSSGRALALILASCITAANAAEVPAQEPPIEPLPLKAERTLDFTTDEGTWISLDVSPDGKTIAFELLGQIYLMPITGGEARAITHGMDFNSQPRFSPDGTRIVFVSDRDGADNVWTMQSDGSDAQRLTKEQLSMFISPSWTADGAYVIVSRKAALDDPSELWMYSIRGGSGVRVTKGKAAPDTPATGVMQAMGPVSSRDGRYFYFAQKYGMHANPLRLPLWQVVRHDRQTGQQVTLTNSPGSGMRPAISPDGRTLVFATRMDAKTGLRVRDMQTGEQRWLKYPVQFDEQETFLASRDLLPGYAFTPDGSAIIAAYNGKFHRINLANGEEQEIPFSARISQPLGPSLNAPVRIEQGPVRARVIQGAVTSPDGKRLAFSALARLYVMDLPAGQPRRVGGDLYGYQPAWSPDGKSLAFVSWTTADGGHIWKVRADGRGSPQKLTQRADYYRDPVWSPDSTRLVALRVPRQNIREGSDLFSYGMVSGVQIVTLAANGGPYQIVTEEKFLQPHFAADGERLYLNRGYDLISIRLDGTDLRTHVRISGKTAYRDRDPDPLATTLISPDGHWAVARFRERLYLVEVPAIGSEPVSINVDAPSVMVKTLSVANPDFFSWEEGGQTISWTKGSTFYRAKLADLIAKGEQQAKPTPQVIPVAVEVPRSKPAGTVVLRGAQVITMKGDEVLKNADVVVSENRIVSVTSAGSAAVPAGARVLDMTGMTIVPGFVDTHAHWNGVRHGILDTVSPTLLVNLAYGVTAGRDPQTQTADMFVYQDLIDAGEMMGPRAYSTGPGIFWTGEPSNLDEVREMVDRYKTHFRTHTVKSYMFDRRKQRQWMVQACREAGIMPTTEGAGDMRLNLTHVIDGFSGIEHNLPTFPLYKDVTELFNKSGTVYSTTMLVDYYGGPSAQQYYSQTTEVHNDSKLKRFLPHSYLDRMLRTDWFHKDEQVFDEMAEAAATIVRAGGKVSVGSHGNFQGIGYHWSLWALGTGMKPMEVLRSATLFGAQAIGYGEDLGSVEPGKLADLVILAKDPLEDIRNTNTIRYVMQNGVLYEGDTLNEIWPRQKPLAPLWFWNADSSSHTDTYGLAAPDDH